MNTGGEKHRQDRPDPEDQAGQYPRVPKHTAACPVRPMISPDEQENRRIGGLMIGGVWLLLLGMLTWFGHQWYEKASNPNQRVVTIGDGSSQSVQLQANRRGHYLANGRINDHEVTFLLDTGATSISLPAHIAQRAGIYGEYPVQVNTANGSVTAYGTSLKSVSLGGLTLQHVRGHINPGLQGDEVLLGMSFLRHFDLRASNNRLTISTQ